jgi:hypothetical protein
MEWSVYILGRSVQSHARGDSNIGTPRSALSLAAPFPFAWSVQHQGLRVLLSSQKVPSQKAHNSTTNNSQRKIRASTSHPFELHRNRQWPRNAMPANPHLPRQLQSNPPPLQHPSLQSHQKYPTNQAAIRARNKLH